MSSSAFRTKVTDLLGLLVRAPRTVPELTELTGMTDDNVRVWLRLWIAEGLVAETHAPRTGNRGQRPFLYTWVGAPQ